MTTTDSVAPDSGRSLAPLHAIANRCTAGSCPTIFTAAGGSLVVQGFVVTAEQAGIDVPAGEALVEIPFELLTEAINNLS